MTTLNLNVSELDFDAIKASLKDFLSGQTAFTDYNFEGSALSLILDALAYNTHYNAIYQNFAVNEAFLDSAIKRASVVSRAKELGYIPASARAATTLMRLTISVTGTPPNPLIIPGGTRFSARASDGTTYSFITMADVSAVPSGNTYYVDLVVYQGSMVEYTYTVDSSDPNQRFVIPHENADLRFLSVSIKSSSSSTTWKTWTENDNVVTDDVSADSEVFFVQEGYDGKFEVYFGDGILGQQPVNGNVIKMRYLVTSGEAANNITGLTLATTIPGAAAISTSQVYATYGGSDIESTESVRLLAPKIFQAQNRAVTANDYIAIIKQKYSNVNDVLVWGGEDNIPYPFYGKVFASIQPKANVVLSETVKAAIAKDLKDNYSVITITPELVNPEYIYIRPSVFATYNSKTTTLSTTIDSNIRSAVSDYLDSVINYFNKKIYVSALLKDIVDSDENILGANMSFVVERRFIPSFSVVRDYTVYMSNAIVPGTLVSSTFYINGTAYILRDTPDSLSPHQTGTLRIINYSGTDENVFLADTGTIDYSTGEVSINGISFSGISGNYLSLFGTCLPTTIDVDVSNQPTTIGTNEQNQVLQLGQVNVTLIPA